jgi:hypothetical protein
VIDGGGADSMHRFQLERGCVRIKRCQKMKRRQRVHLRSMGRNRDMAQQRGDVGWRRDGTGEGKVRRRRQLG